MREHASATPPAGTEFTVPHPIPLPKAALEGCLRRHVARRLPELRRWAVPPCRHSGVTLLIYWYPKTAPDGSRPLDPCEFALRQSWDVLGFLPTVVVTDRRWPALDAFAQAFGVEIQEEPTLVPGDIWSMTLDCVARLHTRFRTRHVLIVQNDGWPLRDELDAFLRYDCVGAPCVTPGWRETVADLLGLTVLNGGFTLRSRRLCQAVARRWQWLWRYLLPSGHPWLSEDIFYTRTLRLADPWFRLRFRFAPARVARRFSVECLEGALPVPLGARPMGFHGRLTLAAFEPSPALTVVSVVRDAACHARGLRENPHLAGARFVTFDNAAENRPIPERYNAFLEHLPEDTEWILFAHEDFEPLEDPRPLLTRCSPLFPDGLIGTRKVLGTFILPFGQIEDSNRDGTDSGLRRPRALLSPLLEPPEDLVLLAEQHLSVPSQRLLSVFNLEDLFLEVLHEQQALINCAVPLRDFLRPLQKLSRLFLQLVLAHVQDAANCLVAPLLGQFHLLLLFLLVCGVRSACATKAEATASGRIG